MPVITGALLVAFERERICNIIAGSRKIEEEELVPVMTGTSLVDARQEGTCRCQSL